MRTVLILIALAMALPAQGLSGPQDPVSLASVEVPGRVRAGRPFKAVVEVGIEPPYHIYSLEPGEAVLPTRFEVPGGGRVRLAGPVSAEPGPSRHESPDYGYWEGFVTFTVPLVVAGREPAEGLAFDLRMHYQACTMESCLEPASLTRTLTVEVQEGAPGIEARRVAGPVSGEVLHVPGRVLKGGRFVAAVRLTMEPPYHVYGLEEAAYTLPTSFEVLDPAGLVTRAGRPSSDRSPLHHDDGTTAYDYYEGEVVFLVPLRMSQGAPEVEHSFGLQVRHMACTMESCLAEDVLTLPVTVRISPQAAHEKPGEAGDAEDGGGGAAPENPRSPGDGPEAGGDGEAAVPEAGDGGEPAPEAAAGRAEVEGGSVTPSRRAVLLLHFGPELELEGAELPASAVQISGSDLEVAGPARVVRQPDGVLVRVPVEVSSKLVKEEQLEIRGSLRAAGGSWVPFRGETSVEVPLLIFVMLAAGAAAFALLTPCVYPMIPVTVSFFTKQAEQTHHRPMLMGVLYCVGIVVSFVGLGAVVTAALNDADQAIAFAQSGWTQAAIGLLFVFFALALFGLFELKLPASVQALVGRAQGRGGIMGVWLLGLLFAITTFTCTAPFVGTILAGAVATGRWTRPILGMAVFSSVLAAPFFFLSAFPAKLKSLPRAGGWMNRVKVCMGFIELAAALKFLGGMDQAWGWDVFTRSFVIALWVAIFGAMGLYLLNLFRLPHDGPMEKTGVWSLMLALLCLSFSIYLSRGLGGEPLHELIDANLPQELEERSPAGRRNLLIERVRHALGASAAGAAGSEDPVERKRRRYLGIANKLDNSWEESRRRAREVGAPLFINFTAYV